MDRARKDSISIDEYIQSFPEHIRVKLTELRKLIHEIAPEATEKISYKIPTFYLKENLVHFAAYARHIGLYPTSTGVTNFAAELAKYKTTRGAIQFPIEEPLPVELIRKIVEFRVREVLAKSKKRAAGTV